MAKYPITHQCGHTETHELFGPGRERDKKISWLKTTDCKACWSAAQREARKSEPITAEVIYNAFSEGVWLAVTHGDTYSIKDTLKAAGCLYREYSDNSDLLGIKAPRKAWMIKIDPNDEAGTMDTIQRLMDAGVTRIDDTTNPLSSAIASHLESR